MSIRPLSSRRRAAALAALVLSAAPLSAATFSSLQPLIGTLESDPARIAATNDAGAPGVVIGIAWNRCEPAEGQFDEAYLRSLTNKIATFRAGAKRVVLDFGVQYPPGWIFREATASFVNQYGHAYEATLGSGDCGVNLVFSQKMREIYGAYLDHLFRELGTDYTAIRLGGGRYGELGYPGNQYRQDGNCYWAFDALAQGRLPGLPPGVRVCPVPGWRPGQASPGHTAARQFLDWYMESMENYHDWQIVTLRKYYAGPLFILYPSTGGLRPGQLEAAIEHDADGSTGPERTGEVGRGFDMARYVAGITDPQVVVYSTWLDGFFGSDDTSPDPARWSPGHYLASLAAAHRPPLPVGGENTGSPDDRANMELTFRHLREDHLCVLFWAFEKTLFDGKEPHATVQDFKRLVASSLPAQP